jgi:hypothetical protein
LPLGESIKDEAGFKLSSVRIEKLKCEHHVVENSNEVKVNVVKQCNASRCRIGDAAVKDKFIFSIQLYLHSKKVCVTATPTLCF